LIRYTKVSGVVVMSGSSSVQEVTKHAASKIANKETVLNCRVDELLIYLMVWFKDPNDLVHLKAC